MALTACPPIGGGTLLMNGTGFFGPVSVNVGCRGTPVLTNTLGTQMSCTLAAGSAGANVTGFAVTTVGGTYPASNSPFSFYYGKHWRCMLLLFGI